MTLTAKQQIKRNRAINRRRRLGKYKGLVQSDYPSEYLKWSFWMERFEDLKKVSSEILDDLKMEKIYMSKNMKKRFFNSREEIDDELLDDITTTVGGLLLKCTIKTWKRIAKLYIDILFDGGIDPMTYHKYLMCID